MADPSHDNRRRQRRIPVDCEVTFTSESNFYVGFTENVSEGGLFVASTDLLPPGTEVNLRFTLPGDDAPTYVDGVVRWQRWAEDVGDQIAPGLGIEFVGLDPVMRARIEEFVQRRMPLFYPD